jgi:hypothetical protein
MHYLVEVHQKPAPGNFVRFDMFHICLKYVPFLLLMEEGNKKCVEIVAFNLVIATHMS